jgi:hypothetical protein
MDLTHCLHWLHLEPTHQDVLHGSRNAQGDTTQLAYSVGAGVGARESVGAGVPWEHFGSVHADVSTRLGTSW